jgi:2-polyprenyl-6-methoxyphenol hydroxylase-like FAD-dependent oxidoreductase
MTERDAESGSNGQSVAVSGGSMGGLFTALALRRAGHDVDVYERSTGQLAHRGAGIVAQPRMREFLTDLQGGDRTFTTTTARREYLDADGRVERGYDESMAFTSWDAVYRLLRDAFGDERYHAGRRTVGVEPEDGAASLRFEDGSTVRAALAVVAEGGRSDSRDALLPDVEPEYAGYVAWRGVVPEAELPADVRDQFADTFTFHRREDDLVLGYFIPGPDGGTDPGERRLNWVWYDPVPDRAAHARLLTDADGEGHDYAVAPGGLRASVESELRASAERFPPAFADLVAATDDPFVQTIYDLEVPELVFGRVCLLGDAAFVARPHTAAGTAKAAADGVDLADALADHEDLGAALDDWEASRLRAGRRLVAQGKRMGESYMD